ncbi:MAG: cell division protein FtsA [Ignavibacteria bacterium]|nr:cell division protein FtsA [Ignavibacteria bacterium]
MKTRKQDSEIIVGLDVGTTKICAIIAGVRNDGNIDIIGIGKAPSEGLSRGVVVNPQKAISSISQALRNAESNSGININSVSVGISGHHIRCIQTSTVIGVNNSDRTIHEEDVERALEQAKLIRLPSDTKIIDVIPQEYIIDDREKVYDSPVGMYGIKLEVKANVVTGLISSIDDLSKCVTACDVDLEDIVLEPIASSLAVLDDTEKKVGVAMIDIGGGTTDIAVFKKGVLKYTAGIGIAGNLVTKDIVEGLGILEDEAERIKKEYGFALVSEVLNDEFITVKNIRGQEPKKIKKSVLARIIQARMEEIFDLSAIEIKNSQIQDELHAGVVITGGGSLLRFTKELAEKVLGMEVNCGKPRGISGGLVREIESPIYATGVGLVLFKFKNLEKSKSKFWDKKKRGKKIKTDKIFRKIKDWFDEL